MKKKKRFVFLVRPPGLFPKKIITDLTRGIFFKPKAVPTSVLQFWKTLELEPPPQRRGEGPFADGLAALAMAGKQKKNIDRVFLLFLRFFLFRIFLLRICFP